MGSRVLLVLATGLVVGCGNKQGASSVSGDSANIVNGSNVTSPNKYSKHTVFIQARSADGSGGMCTGSILDSKTILTAAHCLAGAEEAAIVFATNPRGSVTREQVRKVTHAAIHPGFVPRAQGEANNEETDQDGSHPTPPVSPIPRTPTVDEVVSAFESENAVLDDVAVLRFDGGLPAGYEAVQLADSASLSQAGARLHMIGYGLSRVGSQMRVVNGQPIFVPVPDHDTTGTLRETEVDIAHYSQISKLIFTNGTSTSVCSGDSGGPAFVTSPSGQVVQVGIAEAVANGFCNSVSMHTAIVPYLDWIREAAAHIASLPAETASL